MMIKFSAVEIIAITQQNNNFHIQSTCRIGYSVQLWFDDYVYICLLRIVYKQRLLLQLTNCNKKAVQGNRSMPQLFFSVESSPTTFITSLRVAKLRKPGFRAPNKPAQNKD